MPESPVLTWPLPCIICGRNPKPVFETAFEEDEPNWQPYGATTFTSIGQYGSTVFDDEGGRLMIDVCDHCMRERAQVGLIARVTPRAPLRQPADYEAWLPYREDGDE